MAQQLPPILNFTPENIVEQLKKNVILIKSGNRKFILKGKRDKEKNILESLRFQNEKRIYKTFSESNFENLNIPQHSLNGQSNDLILEYISSNKGQSVPA